MQLVIDTDTDKLDTVVATLAAAYGKEVTVGGRHRTAARGPARRARRARSGPTSADVRTWAAANGVEVSPRGRISGVVWEQFRAAN